MSQYFNLVFIFFKLILINHFICHSFCDIQSLELLFYNNSGIEILGTIDSNSSINDHGSLNRINTLSLGCDCGQYEICCPFNDKNETVCSNSKAQDQCKKYFGQNCTRDIDCGFNLICNKKTCSCGNNESWQGKNCELKRDENSSAMQIYKITMIFASCCLALILIIFLVCILRKSYCAARRQVVPLDNTTIPDIFTLFPHVGNYDGGPLADGTQPPFEKPPTYDETLTLIRNEIGIPPPAYRSGNSPNSTNPSTPEMNNRVLISNPRLFTVNSQNNSRSNSGSNLSSDESLAGPSGCATGYTNGFSGGTSRQGIDNPAFC